MKSLKDCKNCIVDNIKKHCKKCFNIEKTTDHERIFIENVKKHTNNYENIFKKTKTIALLCVFLPFTLFVIFFIIQHISPLETNLSLDGALAFYAGILAFIGTISLGSLSLWQNINASKINVKLLDSQVRMSEISIISANVNNFIKTLNKIAFAFDKNFLIRVSEANTFEHCRAMKEMAYECRRKMHETIIDVNININIASYIFPSFIDKDNASDEMAQYIYLLDKECESIYNTFFSISELYESIINDLLKCADNENFFIKYDRSEYDKKCEQIDDDCLLLLKNIDTAKKQILKIQNHSLREVHLLKIKTK